MNVIFIILGLSILYLSIYFLVSHFITQRKIKKHQKEWNLIRNLLIEIFPNITQNDIFEYYSIYLENLDGYYPHI